MRSTYRARFSSGTQNSASVIRTLHKFASPTTDTIRVARVAREWCPAAGLLSGMLRTLLIDNYDSYTYNLFQLLCEVNGGAINVSMPPVCRCCHAELPHA